MKKIILSTLFTTAACFTFGCSGDNSNNDGGTDASTDVVGNDVVQQDSGSDGGIPAVPTLKTQVDRMGRPAINTALNHVFDPACTALSCAPKDAYNADMSVSTWGASYAAQFAANLAILDALDGVCGNQAAYNLVPGTGYLALAKLAADDQLYVDTSKSTCSQYLAVELNATAIKANTDCGGRTLTDPVIWTTYTALAAGKLDNSITDVLSGPVTSKTNGTTFPYLAPPI